MAGVNEFGQPVGVALQDWEAPPFPPHATLKGRSCQLEPLKSSLHAQEIWNAQCKDPNGARWTYMPYGPFATFQEFEKWCEDAESSRDPQFYAIAVDGRAVGFVSYLRINPSHGVIEVGHVYYSLALAKTRAATEVIYLLAASAFKLGYRRFEWKCDAFNLPSRNAAARLGFTYEGTFRQAVVYKGRTRDTAWFAIIDKDWSGGLNNTFERWLDATNFDADEQQKLKLSELTAPFVHARP
ncbi:hypothetical protein PHYPSEUDO_003675 [Phytophthora pseudosyringae]|uniref:N-acetyltransferase domain-containing protein n=1 Tax=Phytophthora pseudosyringae TaxID=221518 RepID=A0A8T1VQ03_9STRA|nr:hypothetical protein PHYPSEUDO_003675 [Phytophthora pseudosyringae]